MKVWILFIAICLLVCSVSAQPLSSEKMATVKASIISGSEGLAYKWQNPNILYLTYRIADYDSATYDYRIRLFTNGHEMIVDEIPLTNAAGIAKYKVNALDAMQGTYWLNLMAELKGDDEQQMTWCEAHGYPCEISKNLDIVRFDVGVVNAGKCPLADGDLQTLTMLEGKTLQSTSALYYGCTAGDVYQSFIGGAYYRSKNEPKGAAWKNRG